MSRVTVLYPGYKKSKMSEIKGNQTRHVVTLNPNSANPEEDIYIDIPKLNPNLCLVPDSLRLLFNFKNKNTKSWFLNNLSKLLKKRLVVKFSGEIVYDNTGESLLEIYKDLWKPEYERSDMIEYGIGNENVRKLISKDDSGVTSGNPQKVSDKLMFDIFGTKQCLKLEKILSTHGLYSPYGMMNNFQYIITLPKASEIMISQSGQSVGGYSLENLELEYETIENLDLSEEVLSNYSQGRSLSFNHVTLMKTVEWDKDATLHNETINIPRKSMKAVVLLFRNKTVTDSEEFVYPNITEVKISVEGVPNSIYSQGMPKSRFFEEAFRIFHCGYESCESVMSLEKFYKDAFALCIDLRTINDDFVYGDGKKLVNTQSGILLEIKKKAITANVKCHIFVLSDGLLNIVNKDLSSIQF